MNRVDEETSLVDAIVNKVMDKIENLSLEANQISRGQNCHQRGQTTLIAADAEMTDNLHDVAPAKSRVVSYATALLDFAKPVEAKDTRHGKDAARIMYD